MGELRRRLFLGRQAETQRTCLPPPPPCCFLFAELPSLFMKPYDKQTITQTFLFQRELLVVSGLTHVFCFLLKQQ